MDQDGSKRTGCDFTTALLGGRWTQQHLGVPYDAFQGKAAAGQASEWCSMFSLPRSLWGWPACTMVQAWCSRMQHFMGDGGRCELPVFGSRRALA